jgi:predicted NAD/FAD-binding protein
VRIAVIGGGVSGLVAASVLHPRYDITLFEAGHALGGHARTVTPDLPGGPLPVDTGFIVYNERNYPRFTRLLAWLGVATQPSTMSFSVRVERTGLEYNGTSWTRLFAQRRNLVRPSFYRMLADIARFSREAPHAVVNGASGATLGEYVTTARYSAPFVQDYLLPMTSAVWSQPRARALDMPARHVVQFYEHHGMLSLGARPQWRTITGGSAQYVAALAAPLAGRIRLGHRVRDVRRLPTGVTVDGEPFDHVVLACHADQALRLLADPTPAERDVLGALPFQVNEALLHTDTTLLPRRPRAWAAWNYLARDGQPDDAPAAVTYNLTALQALPTRATVCVSLNAAETVDPRRVLDRVTFDHPVYTLAGAAARARRAAISGDRTHYCGAYWGAGFHEDGVSSALAVCAALGAAPPW